MSLYRRMMFVHTASSASTLAALMPSCTRVCAMSVCQLYWLGNEEFLACGIISCVGLRCAVGRFKLTGLCCSLFRITDLTCTHLDHESCFPQILVRRVIQALIRCACHVHEHRLCVRHKECVCCVSMIRACVDCVSIQQPIYACQPHRSHLNYWLSSHPGHKTSKIGTVQRVWWKHAPLSCTPFLCPHTTHLHTHTPAARAAWCPARERESTEAARRARLLGSVWQMSPSCCCWHSPAAQREAHTGI